jgi:hypothetical protein
MAHRSDGTYNAQGLGASAAPPKTPKSRAVIAPRGQEDHKEAQRELPRAANNEASLKTDHNTDHSGRAVTLDYANDWDLVWLGADVKFKEAREAPDNSKDKADKDSAYADGEDDNGTKAIASRDLTALDTLAENRSI